MKTTDVAGDWVNELGSTMTLDVTSDGVVTGCYLSSKAGHDEKTEPLQGLCREGSESIYVGWSVCYTNTKEPGKDPSVCAFSGQYDKSAGIEVIQTTWLNTHMTSEYLKWDSTTIGRNTFVRPENKHRLNFPVSLA